MGPTVFPSAGKRGIFASQMTKWHFIIPLGLERASWGRERVKQWLGAFTSLFTPYVELLLRFLEHAAQGNFLTLQPHALDPVQHRVQSTPCLYS